MSTVYDLPRSDAPLGVCGVHGSPFPCDACDIERVNNEISRVDLEPVYYKLIDDKDIIDAAFQAGEGEAFCRWSILKYIKRAGRKSSEPAIKDLKKAREVIERWITHIQMR